MEETLVFIDEGFLAKLSKHFGKGKYLKIDYLKFAKNIAKINNLFCKQIFYYTSPPFQSDKPTPTELKMKAGYDKFVKALDKNKKVIVRQGRCQKLYDKDGNEEYRQKGVDALIVSDMVSVPIKFRGIKKVILVSSDTDFCPIIKDVEILGVDVLLCTYYEKKRKSKFSVSHHLIDCCKEVYYLSEKDFKDSQLNKEVNKK